MSALALLTVVLVSAAFPAQAPVTPAAPAPASARILVVPFENTQRETRLTWLGEASAMLLADELNARGLAAITRDERVQAFEQLHLPVAASLSRATVIKVGQLLGASEVIAGAFRMAGDQLVVEAHSIRIEVGRLAQPATERGSLKDFFAIYDRLARRLSAGAPRTTPAIVPPPPGAFESYIKGLLAESAATQATFLESAINEFPGFDQARLALWDVRNEQGDHAAALAAVRPVAPGSPFAARAQLRIGLSLLETRDYAAAAAAFTRLLDPQILKTTAPPPARLAPVLNDLGIVQLRRGASADAGSAVYYLTRAADADPEQVDYQFNLGYAYLIDRNHKAALYWLREAVRRDVTDADAHYLLARALQATGSDVEAARERDLARQLSSKYEEERVPRDTVPAGLERLRMDLDSPATVRPTQAIASSAQRDQRDLAAFHLDRGKRLFEREQDREAMAELRRAVYLSPYEAAAHLLIGRIHLRAGRPADAIDTLKISIWSEDSAAARIALAEAYLAAKNTAAAHAELQRALTLDPSSSDARRLLETIKNELNPKLQIPNPNHSQFPTTPKAQIPTPK
jgi:tetratricopeptide (TPR) repeat protein